MLRHANPGFDQSAPFDLFAFLEGRCIASGFFEDRFGRLRRSFQAGITGHRDGQVLTVDEVFAFDDGSADTRRWTLTADGADGFTGQCDEALGVAAGRLARDRASMRYRIRLNVGPVALAVTFDDVFYPVDHETMLNRASVRKFGFEIGQVLIVFRRAAPPPSRAAAA